MNSICKFAFSIHLLICTLLIILMLSQVEKQPYKGPISSNSFFKNKKFKSIESKKRKFVAMISCLFILSSINVVNVTNKLKKEKEIEINHANIEASNTIEENESEVKDED